MSCWHFVFYVTGRNQFLTWDKTTTWSTVVQLLICLLAPTPSRRRYLNQGQNQPQDRICKLHPKQTLSQIEPKRCRQCQWMQRNFLTHHTRNSHGIAMCSTVVLLPYWMKYMQSRKFVTWKYRSMPSCRPRYYLVYSPTLKILQTASHPYFPITLDPDFLGSDLRRTSATTGALSRFRTRLFGLVAFQTTLLEWKRFWVEPKTCLFFSMKDSPVSFDTIHHCNHSFCRK